MIFKQLYNSNEIYKYNVKKANIYNDKIYFYILKAEKVKGFEEINNNNKKNNKKYNSNFSYKPQNTFKRIKDYLFSNDFYYFCTITISNNKIRYDITKAVYLLRQKLKKLKRNNKDLKYIFIIEKHKDGAIHFHGFLSKIDTFYNNYGHLDNNILNTIGFINLEKATEKNKKYILKYILKQPTKDKYYIIKSKNLKKPLNIYYNNDKINYIKVDNYYKKSKLYDFYKIKIKKGVFKNGKRNRIT